MMLRTFRLLALLLSVVAASACGFHLRDALRLPENLGPVRVVSVDRYSPLAQSLSLSLERGGAQIAGTDVPDASVLDVLSEQWGDTPVAVDAFGRTQELSLRYAVVFELRTGDGTLLVPRQTIELSRDYVSNPVNAIGTEGERDILMRELRREMVAAIVRRIDAYSESAAALIPVPDIPDTPILPVLPDSPDDLSAPAVPAIPAPPAEDETGADEESSSGAPPPPLR